MMVDHYVVELINGLNKLIDDKSIHLREREVK